MREIKFRAWDKDKKDWVTPIGHSIAFPYAISPNKPWDKRLALFGISNEDWEKVVWMQYTGIKDKNGKEIYESDLVKHQNGQISVIEWSQGDWGWFMKSIKNWSPKTSFDSSTDEVIGNIYENPELLSLSPERKQTEVGK